MRAFLCHSSEHKDFVVAVGERLKGILDQGAFYFEDYPRPLNYVTRIDSELHKCSHMIVFVDGELTDWQSKEYTAAEASHKGFVVCLPEGVSEPLPALLETVPRVIIASFSEEHVGDAVAEILKALEVSFTEDGLPWNPHLFSYEKDIIEHYKICLESADEDLPGRNRRLQLQGCPETWPRPLRWPGQGDRSGGKDYEGPQPESMKEGGPQVVAAALSKSSRKVFHGPCPSSGRVKGCMMLEELCFPEAGRPSGSTASNTGNVFPRGPSGLKVGIIVTGGIAPGINAVIDGIVQRQEKCARDGKWPVAIHGLRNGFFALEDHQHSWSHIVALTTVQSSARATEGGSFIGTSRHEGLLKKEERYEKLIDIATSLLRQAYDILYVIGGDGTMKAAHALWTVAERLRTSNHQKPLSIIAIPKTMDNDILWVWQAFGFMSAVEKAREIIETLGTETESNPRLCVVQLFGSDSGFVVSHAVLATQRGRCDLALIPEVPFSMKEIAKHMRDKMRERNKGGSHGVNLERIPRGLVVMAETAIPTDALDYIDHKEVSLSKDEKDALRKYCADRDEGRSIQGQTSDDLRRAGLKIVSKGSQDLLKQTQMGYDDPEWEKLRVFTNEPRHLLRAIPPSCTDIIFGNRLGTLAVDNAMAGYTDVMISQWLTEYVVVPLQLAVLGRKRIPEGGMFWMSVMAKTGQPEDLEGKPSGAAVPGTAAQ